MLVEVSDAVRTPDGVSVVCRVPFGQARMRWCGDPSVSAGSFHVEWTINVNADWGRNSWFSAVAQPGLWMDAGAVVFRARLRGPAELADLEFGDSLVLLEFDGPVPAEAWNSWIELQVPSDQVEIHPYNL
ncbi:hypothetical protein [Dactylosporangium sp. NPDC006015]|uniref:hypothetical protein n=1 Tax=Dactylosporangium sp. NPDC006015 TaxID=3154576 RepID=UPI0033B5161B